MIYVCITKWKNCDKCVIVFNIITLNQQNNNEAYIVLQRTSTNVWGEWMGVMHGDEVEYVFGHPLNKSLEYTDNERDLSLRMIHYFSRFAYTG